MSGGTHRAASARRWILWLSECSYDSATGNNCVMSQSANEVFGNATWIGVHLIRYTEISESPRCTEAGRIDEACKYQYYAGPVSLKAPGRCIRAYGDLTTMGRRCARRRRLVHLIASELCTKLVTGHPPAQRRHHRLLKPPPCMRS